MSLFLYGPVMQQEKFTTPALEPAYAGTADGGIKAADEAVNSKEPLPRDLPMY